MDKLSKLLVKTLFQIDTSKWEIFDLIFNILTFSSLLHWPKTATFLMIVICNDGILSRYAQVNSIELNMQLSLKYSTYVFFISNYFKSDALSDDTFQVTF